MVHVGQLLTTQQIHVLSDNVFEPIQHTWYFMASSWRYCTYSTVNITFIICIIPVVPGQEEAQAGDPYGGVHCPIRPRGLLQDRTTRRGGMARYSHTWWFSDVYKTMSLLYTYMVYEMDNKRRMKEKTKHINIQHEGRQGMGRNKTTTTTQH